jgi:hypothetical protein
MPVNKSPWYAFSVWANEPRQVILQLQYEGEYTHRYFPDVSIDLSDWHPMDSTRVLADSIKQQVSLIVDVGPDTLYIGAQEIMTSKYVYEMIDSLENVRTDIIGYSTLGKPIPLVRFGNPESHDIIAVLGRQHPPEATGFLALQAFISRLLEQEDSLTQRFLSDHQVLLIPMVNPDGVDQGHWRHNAGGIDLNRDWNQFRQPETAAIRSFFEGFMDDDQNRILFMIDFHSTQEDLFYVFDRERSTNLTGFTHDWLDEIESELDWYVADRVPTSGNSPVSTRWFYDTYNTEAVTYEVGDDSPRERIKEISSTAAQAMMELLLERNGRNQQ